MFAKVSLVVLLSVTLASAQDPDEWWRSANVYQILPASFKDSNNDGFGDIQGIISKLDYLVETGVDVLFLAPFYETPFVDFGYDILNHTDVDSRFGSMADFDQLLSGAKARGMRIIIDFVPNHSSIQHEWFEKSAANVSGYENFYVWHSGIPNGLSRPLPPNDWQSVYGGSSWEWNEQREAFYFHTFAKEQPDLNLRESRVLIELDKILTFWLDKGVDGFRLDAVSQLYEDPNLVDDPITVNNLPETYSLVERWRDFLDNYSYFNGGINRILVPQVWDSSLSDLMSYYQGPSGQPRAQVPTNFRLINELQGTSNASDYKIIIDTFIDALPEGAVANWFLGTHDHSRVASRMSPERLDGLTMLMMTLPGIAFTYNGDEIGMTDYRGISWSETRDPWACNAGLGNYAALSRDPARTPFQWDNTVNAGFNEGNPTWIPVNPNYPTNNLQAQQNNFQSFYLFYQKLAILRKTGPFIRGTYEGIAMNENVFAVRREFNGYSYMVLINLSNANSTLDLTKYLIPATADCKVVVAAGKSIYLPGPSHKTDSFVLRPFDTVVLQSVTTGTSPPTVPPTTNPPTTRTTIVSSTSTISNDLSSSSPPLTTFSSISTIVSTYSSTISITPPTSTEDSSSTLISDPTTSNTISSTDNPTSSSLSATTNNPTTTPGSGSSLVASFMLLFALLSFFRFL